MPEQESGTDRKMELWTGPGTMSWSRFWTELGTWMQPEMMSGPTPGKIPRIESENVL